jgi:hypothetical protein
MAPFRYSVIVALMLGAASTPAAALTAEDVTKKMSSDERHAYLSGLIDMLAYQIAAAGDRDKSACITDTFHRQHMEETWTKLHQVLDQYADKRPEVLVSVLARQLCK